jgi:DNA-binding MarR family transcriptional regulator
MRTGWHGFVDELFVRLAAEGFDDLTPSHSPVFQHIEQGGTRIGVLAERARMTTQSMGYLVDALETRGYFERKPDPSDRRASLVVITDRGREEIRVARRLIAGIEREWEERIGADRMALLREALKALASSLDTTSASACRDGPQAPRVALVSETTPCSACSRPCTHRHERDSRHERMSRRCQLSMRAHVSTS